MKKVFTLNRLLLIFVCFISNLSFLQAQNTIENDSLSNDKISVLIEVVNRYIWRGQSWGGDYVVVQPTLEYQLSKKITIGTWATHNFKKDYFYPNSNEFYKGYQEVDLYFNYEVNDFLSVKVWDYYWPSVEKVSGVSNDFFNYGKTGSKTVDLNLIFDLEKVWIPFTFTISTLVAGNDFRYDTNAKAKQNFTTYLEAGYIFETFSDVEINPVVGLVLNNEAGYYTYADYDKPSFVNLSVKATKEIYSHQKLSIPVYVNYVHNAASQNTEIFGKNYLLFGIAVKYN